MATTESDILLKLVIAGQSPTEIDALARSTQGQLNERMKGYLDVLTGYHADANAAIEKGDKAAYQTAQAHIEIAGKQLAIVSQVSKANEAAAERSATAWRGTLEVMANVAISARAMFDVVSGGLSALKNLGESIDKVTNVYGSLKGSIDEMRRATLGEVSDFDLISTKNRALEKELQLNDKQFGAVAAAADRFADSIGVNTKEALNQLVDGLAQGRLKTLAAAGVVIDATKAHEAYARSIGVTSDQLNDHGKKIAIIQAALKGLDEKTVEAGVVARDFSHDWEVTSAKLKNIWDDLLKGIGQLVMKAIEGFTIDLPDGIRLGIAKIKDLIPGGDGKNVERAVAAHEKNLADFYKSGDSEGVVDEAKKRLENPDSYKYGGAGAREDSIDKSKADAARKKAQDERDKVDEFNRKFDDFLSGRGKGEGGPRGLDVPIFSEAERSHDLDTTYDPTGSQRAAPVGLSGGLARQATLRKAFEKKQEADEKDVFRQQQQAAEAMEKVNDDAMTEMLDKADKLRERAGNGIFATLLFGPSGREQLLEDIDAFKNAAGDAMGMVADAGMKMADALGAALGAFVSGDKAKKKSIRDTTFEILEALSTQAYSRAIFETAEGLASLALGPIGGVSASMHFAAAGMFAAVGTGAGLAARGIGHSAPAATGTGAGTGAGASASGSSSGSLTSSGSSFGSSGMRSSGGSGASDQPVVININSPLGDRAEIGRGIAVALSEYYSQSGRGVPLSQGSV